VAIAVKELAMMSAAGLVGDDDFVGGGATHPGDLAGNQAVHLAVFQAVANDKKGTGPTQNTTPDDTAERCKPPASMPFSKYIVVR
jgi:hypothetical protein